MAKLYVDRSELSLGQLYLLDICDKRKITEFWNEKLNQQFSVGYLMKVATGKYMTPSLNFIYSMLTYVEPTDWFYLETEGKKGTPLPKERYVTDITKSLNFKKLQQLRNDKLLGKFCTENFGDKSLLYLQNFGHLLDGRNIISPALIRKLKDVLPVIDWFIEKK